MCTLAIFTRDNTNADPEKDQRGCYKRGMIHAVYEDGVCVEAPAADAPFVFVHVPTVPASRVLKYALPEYDPIDEVTLANPDPIRRRRWRLRWEDLPSAVRNRITSQRQITVAVSGYTGPSDFSWSQVRDFFRDQRTGLNETDNLT